jgi:hypothetical protein
MVLTKIVSAIQNTRSFGVDCGPGAAAPKAASPFIFDIFVIFFYILRAVGL